MPMIRPKVFGKTEETAVSPIEMPPTTSADFYEPVAPSEEFRDEMPLLGLENVEEIDKQELTSVSLRLPKDLYESYQKVAQAQDLTVEEVLQHRLNACKNHNALRGLWFSDLERAQLENLIQKWPLESAAQALSLITRAATIRFDDVQVSLTPAQKKVLAARVGGRSPQSFFDSLLKKEFRV